MGRLSDAVANAVLDLLFGAGSNSVAPTTYYLALSTTTPTNTGTNVTEPSGGAYARVAITNNSTKWPAAASRLKSNGEVITFPTASDTWGEITHFALYDASTAGTFKGWGELDAPQTVTSGGTLSFAPGAVAVASPGA